MSQSWFWWILLACSLFGVLHSLLASLHIKSLAVKWCGENGKRYYRFFFVLIAGVSTPLLGMLIYILPDQALYQIPFPWIYLTLALQLVAAGCLLASLLQTGAISFLGLDPILRPYKKEPVEHLVKSGFFAWTRHPIYFFTFIILWLFPVMTWNLIALIIGITAYTIIGSLFEERKLAIQFGEEYLEYKRKTPWIIPIRLK